MSDPYEQLAALAEVELGLAREGAFDELARVQAERNELVTTLPDVAPAHARQALKRAAALQAATSELLRDQVERARELLATLDHGRRALTRYAPSTRERRHRLDCAG